VTQVVVQDSGGVVHTAVQSADAPHIVVQPATHITWQVDVSSLQVVMQPPLQSTSHVEPAALQSDVQPPDVQPTVTCESTEAVVVQPPLHVVSHAEPTPHAVVQPPIAQSRLHVAPSPQST